MSRRWLDSPRFYVVLALGLLAAAVASQFQVRVPSRSVAPVEALGTLAERDDLNVVFLLVDTLRADRLGTYGYARPTSAILDEAASYGIVFEDVVAQSSWTKTSMASLWTGTHPINNGVLRFDHVLPDSAVLPAEIFRDAGFRTVGLWRNGWVEPNFGFAQGFDTYLKPVPGAERRRLHRETRIPQPLAGSDEDLTITALDFLDQVGDERFFLYLHYMDVHQYVYDEAAAVFGNSYSDIYDQAIHWTDRLIGVLLQRLEDRDLLRRTLVVIAADHGESFLEHGEEGHARNLYDEVTRVPWIVLPPFLLEPGVRVRQTVSNADIWPTLLDLLGLPPLPAADGRSLVPLLLAGGDAGPDADAAPPVFAHLLRGWGKPRRGGDASLVSVTHAGRRLIAPLVEGAPAEFYDRTRDPREQNDLSDADPEGVASLRAELERYRSDAATPWEASPETIELDEMRLNHLRALGYVLP
ncbi:MAG: sulfatase [Myxococcota bacterium]